MKVKIYDGIWKNEKKNENDNTLLKNQADGD